VLILSMIQQRTGVSVLPGLRAFPRLSTGLERSLLIVGSLLGPADSSDVELNVLAVSLQRPAQRSVCLSVSDELFIHDGRRDFLGVRLTC